jgi:hypothetical protein
LSGASDLPQQSTLGHSTFFSKGRAGLISADDKREAQHLVSRIETFVADLRRIEDRALDLADYGFLVKIMEKVNRFVPEGDPARNYYDSLRVADHLREAPDADALSEKPIPAPEALARGLNQIAEAIRYEAELGGGGSTHRWPAPKPDRSLLAFPGSPMNTLE